MPRPFFALVAALFAALLLLAGVTSCSTSPPPPPPPPPSPPTTQLCPDGSVILVTDGCPPMPVVLPPPMANGGDHEPPPPPPPPRPAERDCLSCEGGYSDDYAGSDGEFYEMGEAAEGPDAVAGAARNRAFRGKASFVKPGDMLVENWHPLEFHVGPTEAAIVEETEGRDLTPIRDVWLAPSMRVTLLPHPYFRVRKVTADIQGLGFDRTANWKWQVMPLTNGRHRLQAQVEILVIGPGGKPVKEADGSWKTQKRFDRYVDIEVEVGTWRGFLNAIDNASALGDKLGTMVNAWDKTLIALTGLLGTLAGLVAAWRKLRGKKPKKRRKAAAAP